MDFDLSPRTVGRAAKPIQAEFVRELTAADIALLETERGIKPQVIKKLRDSHHALARSLAAGDRPAVAQLMTGYSLSRISILQADPSFQDLVAFYKSNENEIYTNVHERMLTLALDEIEELREQLQDHPEAISPMTRLEIITKLLDRTGHGPQSKSLNVQMNVDLAGRLERARARITRVIEVNED